MMESDANRNIELRRSENRKDTLDCVIVLREISPQFLILLNNEINNIIRAQSRNFEGCVAISPDTARQLKDLSQLIILHKELTEGIVKNG